MTTVNLAAPVTVTLKAAEWYWLLGALACLSGQGQSRVLDNLYDQIMSETG
jgi:hypothetical protein